MNSKLSNGYRRLGIGEPILQCDFWDDDGALQPVTESQVGELVSQDDIVDFYRDTLSRPVLTFELQPAGQDKAKTDDAGKAPLAQIPWAAIREMSLVQLYGAEKYGDFNNFRKGMEISRNLSCAIRHIASYMEREDNDPESKRSHLAHALCRVAFVLQNIADGVAVDDRYSRK